MANIQDLYAQMQRLTTRQLEYIQEFIATRPYKQEGRAPTDEESDEVIREIEKVLNQAPPPEENEGLKRLFESGDADRFPDSDF